MKVKQKNISKSSSVNNKINFEICKIPVKYLNPAGNSNENIISIEITDVYHKTSLKQNKGPISRLLVLDVIEVSLSHV